MQVHLKVGRLRSRDVGKQLAGLDSMHVAGIGTLLMAECEHVNLTQYAVQQKNIACNYCLEAIVDAELQAARLCPPT